MLLFQLLVRNQKQSVWQSYLMPLLQPSLGIFANDWGKALNVLCPPHVIEWSQVELL